MRLRPCFASLMASLILVIAGLQLGCQNGVNATYLDADQTFHNSFKPVIDAYDKPDRQTYVDLYTAHQRLIDKARAAQPTTAPAAAN